jgi:hypothetical protein
MRARHSIVKSNIIKQALYKRAKTTIFREDKLFPLPGRIKGVLLVGKVRNSADYSLVRGSNPEPNLLVVAHKLERELF